MDKGMPYSLHLGSDKNKKNSVRTSAKNNVSGTTSKSNNAIQNAKQLSRVDKHNYRKYDYNQEDIYIVKGSDSLYEDVKKLYLDLFEESRIKYNEKQRETRKINDYFSHITDNSKHDLACEFIIKLGNKKYWDTKDMDFKKKMTNVYKQQVEDLEMLVPNFKIASAIIHYDETSPHMHIVGVPVKEKNKTLQTELNNLKELFEKIKNKLNDLYHFFVDKMWGDKEKRDKYYPVAYELYGKNILDEEQMRGILATKHRSAEMDRESRSRDDDMEL